MATELQASYSAFRRKDQSEKVHSQLRNSGHFGRVRYPDPGEISHLGGQGYSPRLVHIIEASFRSLLAPEQNGTLGIISRVPAGGENYKRSHELRAAGRRSPF